jgi:hypothetical protein
MVKSSRSTSSLCSSSSESSSVSSASSASSASCPVTTPNLETLLRCKLRRSGGMADLADEQLIETMKIEFQSSDDKAWEYSNKIISGMNVYIISKEHLFLYRAENCITCRLNSANTLSEQKKLRTLLKLIGEAKKLSANYDEAKSANNAWQDPLHEGLQNGIADILKEAARPRSFFSFSFFSKPKSLQALTTVHSEIFEPKKACSAP